MKIIDNVSTFDRYLHQLKLDKQNKRRSRKLAQVEKIDHVTLLILLLFWCGTQWESSG